MNHIPAEIVSAIGERLDGRSLVACLQVSWDWHHTFLPLVWGTVSKKDWVYHSFTLTTWTPLSDDLPNTHPTAQFNARVHRYLQHIRSLTWHNNSALLRDRVFVCLPSQMHLRQFSIVLQRTPNLTSFSLVMATNGIEDYILLWILHLLQRLEHLTALEVDLPRQGSVTAIEQHFPLFAKLEKLKIAGNWYSGGASRTLDTAAVMAEDTPAWKVRRLEIDRIDISFFRLCPELEHLTLNTPSCGYMAPESSAVKEVIVGQLEGLARLRTMVVYKSFGWREYVHKIVKVEGSEMKWTRGALSPGQKVGQDVFTLRDVFGLSQPSLHPKTTTTCPIPTEVLLAIGELLDGQSLVACLQVTRDWHDALCPFVWTTILERQWTHHAFLPVSWIPLSDYNGPLIASQEQRKVKLDWGLQHTRSLTFFNNNALMKKLSWYGSKRLLRQIFTSQLVHVVQSTPNLVRFSLVVMSRGLDDINLATMLMLLHKMPKLEAVEIDLPYRTCLVPIKHHFQLFARLKELKIGGDWYRGIKTVGSAPDKITPWKLKHLPIDRLDMSFFHYCLNLEKFSLISTGLSFGVPRNTPVNQKVMEQLRQLGSKTSTNSSASLSASKLDKHYFHGLC